MTKIISNITIVMNDGARSQTPCKFTVTDSGLIERAKRRLAQAVSQRNSMLGCAGFALKQSHDEVLLLRSIITDLEAGV